MSKQAAALHDAIRVMSAWSSQPVGRDFTREQIDELLQERGVEDLVDLLDGFVSLAGVLLIERERETGKAPLDSLRDIGVRYGGQADD